MDTPAPLDPAWADERVLGWQTKLHRWAAEDENKRFGDLFNLLCDPATLVVAWERVKQNRGSKTAGVDGETRKRIEQTGVENVLSELRQSLRDGSYAPLPVRERKIPKRGTGKVRSLGIPALRDRIVQMAAKLVLEPIFEADFCPTSFGFRPGRRAQDAIEEARRFINPPGCYEWVIEGDVENAFCPRIYERTSPASSARHSSLAISHSAVRSRMARSSAVTPAARATSVCSS